jgi:DNA-binding NarL/FixJ family response regulator
LSADTWVRRAVASLQWVARMRRSELLAAIRLVASDERLLPPVPQSPYMAAASRLDTHDLPVLAMLVEGESLDAIAAALRTDRETVAWRAQRIIGRLRPGASGHGEGYAMEAGDAVA